VLRVRDAAMRKLGGGGGPPPPNPKKHHQGGGFREGKNPPQKECGFVSPFFGTFRGRGGPLGNPPASPPGPILAFLYGPTFGTAGILARRWSMGRWTVWWRSSIFPLCGL